MTEEKESDKRRYERGGKKKVTWLPACSPARRVPRGWDCREHRACVAGMRRNGRVAPAAWWSEQPVRPPSAPHSSVALLSLLPFLPHFVVF